MLKWRGVWEGVWGWLDLKWNSKKEERVKLYPKAGTKSSRVPAMEDPKTPIELTSNLYNINLLIQVMDNKH